MASKMASKIQSSHIFLSRADRKMMFASKGMFSGQGIQWNTYHVGRVGRVICYGSNPTWLQNWPSKYKVAISCSLEQLGR